MSHPPQRGGPQRTAMVSIVAAVALITVKAVAGVASGSLALVSEAVHSGTDLVAAILAYLALRVAVRPPDEDHPYGHGKAEHLSALMEGVLLVLASGVILSEAVRRLAGEPSHITTGPWIYGTLALVICLDAGRTLASWRASRRHNSAALAAGAVHFASDFAGTLAVLVGLLMVDAGHAWADPVAAIIVAILVLGASIRLMRRNADILLDRAHPHEVVRAQAALQALAPAVRVTRLRLRSAGGGHFADVVVAMAPDAALAQAHAAADAVEVALERALPGVDAVVHVEPGEGPLDDRVRAAAQSVRGVREVHNVRLSGTDGALEVSMHIKLPPRTALSDAQRATERIAAAVRAEAREVREVHVHLEPLQEGAVPGPAEGGQEAAPLIADAVHAAVGVAPDTVRLVRQPEGMVAYITIPLPGDTPLEHAHTLASRARLAGITVAGVADVFVQTTASAAPSRPAPPPG